MIKTHRTGVKQTSAFQRTNRGCNYTTKGKFAFLVQQQHGKAPSARGKRREKSRVCNNANERKRVNQLVLKGMPNKSVINISPFLFYYNKSEAYLWIMLSQSLLTISNFTIDIQFTNYSSSLYFNNLNHNLFNF